MDSEFQRLLTAVKEGRIREADRVREILRNARTAVDAKREGLQEMESLLFEAQEAFVVGWR
jgi:hypothetical protein